MQRAGTAKILNPPPAACFLFLLLYCLMRRAAVREFGGYERLKAAFHYTVACLCQEVAEDKNIQFSRQTIAAISEITFRQCEFFAKDLEMFAKHGKRSTVNVEDVKLLARRSNSLLKYITQKSDELSLNNLEQKERKKKKSAAKKGGRNSNELEEPVAIENEDSNMA
ncbi:centromere protein S isoform X1 [Pantherophis guttatus]|uniref:Centromere protein S n=1 Tax=Pantherophis guttatus TaxID=94885 RepID=A0A6P9DQT8_PANGU|nr:centromere protein S isoform X1 [Pantherophis guttatus]